MRSKELLTKLRTQPFQPFAVITSAGSRYGIRHPELAHVGEDGNLYVFEPAKSDEAEVATLPTVISLLHVTSLEPLRESAA